MAEGTGLYRQYALILVTRGRALREPPGLQGKSCPELPNRKLHIGWEGFDMEQWFSFLFLWLVREIPQSGQERAEGGLSRSGRVEAARQGKVTQGSR